MVYCIAKIEETHGITYYPIKNYNPKEYCNSDKNDIRNIRDIMMSLAAKSGQIGLVKLMIEKGADDIDQGMQQKVVI